MMLSCHRILFSKSICCLLLHFLYNSKHSDAFPAYTSWTFFHFMLVILYKTCIVVYFGLHIKYDVFNDNAAPWYGLQVIRALRAHPHTR